METSNEVPNPETQDPSPTPGTPEGPEKLLALNPVPTGTELVASDPTPSLLAPLASQPPAAKPPTKSIVLNSAIGKVDLRTPEEDVLFQECETVVGECWGHVARMGAALARIRDKRLFKNEHSSFDEYCQQRWGFGRTQGDRYIAAAEVHQMLSTLPGVPLPKCEAQIRPLIGLPPTLTNQAWLNALSLSPTEHVPARLVKRAVQQLLKTETPSPAVQPAAERMQRSRLRQSAKIGFQELLTMLLGTTERDVLIAKVQEIQRLLEPLLSPKKQKCNILPRNQLLTNSLQK